MLWKVEYSHYTAEPEFANGKKEIMRRALCTLQRFPSLKGDLYKFRGDEKIYVESHEFDVKKWNTDGKVSLKRCGSYDTQESNRLN